MTAKYDIAQYLVNLHTLLDAQKAIGVNPSTTIADEYNRTWGLLKKEIEINDSRQGNDVDSRIDKDRTDKPRGEPSRRV